jgi:hypothetical protein
MSRSISRGMGKDEDTERFVRDVDRLLADQPVEEEFTDDAYRADLEVANLLGRVQFTPDPRFRSRLRSHMLHQLSDEEVQRMSPMRIFRSLVRPVLVAGLSAVVVLAVVFAVSPAVRAAAQEAAQELVARFVEVDSPWALLLGGEEGPALPDAPAGPGEMPDVEGLDVEPPWAQGVPSVPGYEGGPDIEKLDLSEVPASGGLLSLEEAQADLDFEIRVPSVLPEGYSFLGVMAPPELAAELPDLGIESPAGVPRIEAPQSAILIFGNAAGERLTLSELDMRLLGQPPGEIPLPAGSGAVQDVTVNGQPAQYVAGRWTEDGWVFDGHYLLHWQGAEGIMYDLISHVLDLEQLLPVAESIE